MFIISITYTQPLAAIDDALAEHRAFLDRYYASEDLVCSGPKNPREGGVILARTKDRRAVEAIIAQDPFKQRGLAEYDIIEFSPVKWSRAFTDCL